ncbi:DegT/DnrJ/EryC1/StrS family aminotransferase [Patescibacteria group bacterium]|nr:DegT/DnrJ/EryC1/StrS family aminotransferase [Patescibacteria group bacterium]
MSNKAIKDASQVLKTRWIGQGPKVDQVEKKFSKMFKIPYSVTVNSGTSALHLALILAGVGPGDEVISTPITCSATNIPVLYLGGKVVFADIQKETMNIDPKSIEKKVTSKTKAIMAVHWAGYPCDMDEINKIAKKHKLKVIEDGAQALGAKYKGKYVGSVSDFTCFSFQAIKPITSVDGGMLCTLKKKDYQQARILRWYGIDREFKGDIHWKYQIKDIGYKYHMNDVTAAILSAQLDDWKKISSQREKIAKRYLKELKDVPGLTLLKRHKDRQGANWTFTMHVEKRNDFQKKLAENGIESHIVHVRNDICPIFGGKKQNLPVMNKIESTYVSIPIHNHLTDVDVSKVIKTIRNGW